MSLFDSYQPSPGDPVYKRGQHVADVAYVDPEKNVIAFRLKPLGPRAINALNIKDFEKAGYTLEPTENPGQPLRNHYDPKTRGYR
jgi:hypothetical protein